MSIPSSVDAALVVEYLGDDDVWRPLGAPQNLGGFVRSRRFGPGPGQSVVAKGLRVVKVGDYDWGAAVMSIDAVRAWAEDDTAMAAAPGNVRLWPFNFDDGDQRYMLVHTGNNAEVHHRGPRVASALTPYPDSYVTLAQKTQELDTLVSFHAYVPPWRLMRQGGHGEWDSQIVSFDAIPLYDYDGTHQGGTSEVQQLTFRDYVGGDTFNITFEGKTTSPITYSGNGGTLAASIQAALDALENIGPGGVSVGSGDAKTVSLTFTGPNAFSDVGDLAPVTLTSDKGGVSGATLTQGFAGGEPVMSATRGWPATGCFYQQRLWLGGFLSRPQTILGSRLGSYFDFTSTTADDDAGIDETLDTDEVTAIRALFPGRHLQAFTSSAEFYQPNEPVTPKSFAAKQTTRRGIQPGTPLVQMDGATLFVCAGGGALAGFLYAFEQDSYTASHLSTLASHIVSGVVDLGFRRAQSTTTCDLAVMVRDTGDAAVMVALQDQDVMGFMPWNTQGRFLACAGELLGDLYAVVLRTLPDGSVHRYLERFDDTRMLDSSVVAGPGVTSVSAPHLKGMTVALYIDGGDAGDAVVADDGTVTLPYAPVRSVEVGLLFQPSGELLPFVQTQDPRAGASQRPRVGEIAMRLGPTANLKAGVSGGRMWRVPLKTRPNALLDQGPGEDAFTGWTRLYGVPGFRPDAQVAFRQDRPGPLCIQEIVATVQS